LLKRTFSQSGADIHEKAVGGTDIICYKFKKYYQDTKTFGTCAFAFPALEKQESFAKKVEYLVSTDSLYFAAWTKAIKKSLLQNNKIQFQKGLIGEDQDWYYQVLLKAQSIVGLDREYIVYRQHTNSVTASWKMKNLTDCIYIIEKWRKGIAQSDVTPELKNALYHSLAKLYCNLLIGYTRFCCKEKKSEYKRLKNMRELFQYNKNPRVAKLGKLYKLCGFDLMMFGLKVVCKIKK
jgi:hypothetical protein